MTPQYLTTVQHWLDGTPVDEPEYRRIENYLLKNTSRTAADAQMQALRAAMETLAARLGRRSITDQQENFGLNSCAQ